VTSAIVDSGGEEELATSDGEDVAGAVGAGEDAGTDGADDTGTELEPTCDGAEVASTEGAGEVPGTDGTTTSVVALFDGTTGTDPEGIGKGGVIDLPGALLIGRIGFDSGGLDAALDGTRLGVD